MSEPFLGEIRMVGFNFPPRGWTFCDGQILPIAQNTALFSLLGTTYGGDGRTTFALPDLRGRVAVHPGNGPGLPTYQWGQRGGTNNYTLTQGQLPSHTHTLRASGNGANTNNPDSNVLGLAEAYSDLATSLNMDPTAITNTGGGQTIDIKPPFLGIYHVIALVGIFPSRN